MGVNRLKISCIVISVMLHLLLLSSMRIYRKPIIDDKQDVAGAILCQMLKPQHSVENITSERITITVGKPVQAGSMPDFYTHSASGLILNKINVADNKKRESRKQIFYPRADTKPDRLVKHVSFDYRSVSPRSRATVSPSYYSGLESRLGFSKVPLPTRENGNIRADEMLRYQEMIKHRINEQLIYPRSAKRSGIEGNVSVKFLILKDGQVSDIRIIHSAYDILSRAAIKTIKLAGPFSALPEKAASEKLTLSLTISFKLD